MNTEVIRDNVLPVMKWNPRRAADGEITYIDIASVSNEQKEIINEKQVLGSEAPSRARQIIHHGDILVSTVEPNLNTVAFVPEHLDGATASTGFCVLRPIKKQLDNRYLFYWVRSPKFIASIHKYAKGQCYLAVSDTIIKSSEIPLPSLAEQKRIATILSQADDLHRCRGSAIEKLYPLSLSIFYDMFGDPRYNNKHLEMAPLADIVKVSSGGSLTSKERQEGIFPVYGGNGINGWHNKANVKSNTIIIGRVGVYCGSIHVTESEAWVTDNALIVQKRKEIDTNYLAYALRVANLNQYAGRSSQPLVSGARIYPIQISLPLLTQQRKFSRKITEIKRHQNLSIASHKHFSKLFSSLQQRAFKGEL